MDRIDPQPHQHSPALTRAATRAAQAAHTAASHTRPNPAAAALYTQAAADYENAARDADRLGAHDRATSHRRRAAEHRALATAYSSHLKTNPLPRQAVAR